MLRAVFKDENNSWQIYYGQELITEYTLDLVPKDYIIETAVRYGKAPEIALFTEKVNNWAEILDWFEREVFPSKAFGMDLIKHFKMIAEELATQPQAFVGNEFQQQA